MKRLIRALIRLYPTQWYRRYGAEMEHVLDQMAPSWATAVDVGKGALAVHLAVHRSIAVMFTGVIGAVLAVVFFGGPNLHAASTTVRLETHGTELDTLVTTALRQAAYERGVGGGIDPRTFIELEAVRTGGAMLRITHRSTDPAQASEVVMALTRQMTHRGGSVLGPSTVSTVYSGELGAAGVGLTLGLLTGIVGTRAGRTRLT